MEMQLLLDIASRWAHVGTAIVIVGGTTFINLVLLPALGALPEEAQLTLRQGVHARWKKFVHIGIVLFLLSGFYNFIRAIPLHKGDGLYHGLIGTKILLALGIFFIASALVGRSPAFEGMRANARKWTGVIVLLAAIIVGISGFAKVRGPVTKAIAPSPAAELGDAAL